MSAKACSVALNQSKGKAMIRNLKALGLALFAVLAMSVVAASGASAQQGKFTSDGPVTLVAKNTAGTVNALTAFGGETKCPNVVYTGHKVLTHTETTAGKKHEPLISGEIKSTITPHYGTCTSTFFGINFPSTVDMNGCDYEFDLGVTTGGADTYGVGATVVCPTGADIVVTVYTPGASHPATEQPFCRIKVTEKAPPFQYTGLHVTDQTNGHLRIHGTIGGIEAHKEDAPHANGFFPCSAETTAAAQLHIDVTVEGRNSKNEKTNISISE
jgi:hypothetical protein